MDGDDIGLASESFDHVVSFETVEHVGNPARFIQELRRILRPGGMLCISTPQNRFGSIPTTPSHTVEFSYRELLDLVSASFEIVDFKGLKAGTIHFENDPIGSNSYVVARR
jgi:SAM-dependent methyltransferase